MNIYMNTMHIDAEHYELQKDILDKEEVGKSPNILTFIFIIDPPFDLTRKKYICPHYLGL